MSIAVVEFETYEGSVPQALDEIGARERLEDQTRVLIKPNLICNAKPPVTTPVECCEAIVRYVKGCSSATIIIAEGCGEPGTKTDEIFESLGYTRMADRLNVKLVDLNKSKVKKFAMKGNRVFREMYLPEICFDCYLISVPMLKAHSIATITGSMKNMIGCAPPQHYSGRGGSWQKSVFHLKMQQSIIELNRYRKPDLSVMDATVGLADFHLGGAHCNPPVNRIIAGVDPLEVDRKAAELLGLDWREIGHLAEGVSL